MEQPTAASPLRPAKSEPSLALQAASVIEQDFPMLAGIDDLAQRLAVSKCHLIRCFTREQGISPGQYLLEVRLLAVQAYLQREDYSVETIAGLTGFACGNYLSKVFRRMQGCTPTQYREQQHSTPTSPMVQRAEDFSYL